MHRPRVLVTTLGACAALGSSAAAALWYSHASALTHSTAPASPPPLAAALEAHAQPPGITAAERDELRQLVLEELRRELAALQPTPAGAEPAPPQPAAAPELDSAGAQEARDQAEFEVRELEFREEPLDGRWAQSRSATIRKALPPQLEDALQELECRSSRCRMEWTQRDPEIGKNLPLLLHQISVALPFAEARHIEHRDGSWSTVLHLSEQPAAQPPTR